MAWVRRGERLYYYRSVRRDGRVTSEYVGSGEAAGLIAALDEVDRDRREMAQEVWRSDHEAWDAAERPLAEWFDRVEDLARAALLAAGYRQHHRREWSKRRGQDRNEARSTNRGA